MTNDLTFERRLKLEGAFNVRELGGYLVEGGRTRPAVLLRGDSLHRLTPADQQALIDYGVRTIIDLRHGAELETAPGVFSASSAVTYCHIPIIRQAPSVDSGMPTSLEPVYQFFVDHCQQGFAEALAAIAEAETGAVLFHCTAGKDRTGVLAALVLSIAGADEDTIAEDFALTEQAMASMRPALLGPMTSAGLPEAIADALLSSDPALMRGLLAHLNDRYGGVFAYLDAIGLEAAQIERIRARFVEREGA